MTISYPLNTPTNIGIANITLMAENAVAISQSPFTFQQQIVVHPGQRWSASISLPPMRRVDAESWVAFLLSLKGQAGTFLLGDPNCFNAQGSALGTTKNLLAFTEQFNNAYWTKSASSITTNSVVSPDGITTADTIIEDNTTNNHFIIRTPPTWVAGQTYTLSLYIKAQSTRNLRLVFPTVPFGNIASQAAFDTTTGAVLLANPGITASSESVGNGWFRVWITKAATDSVTGGVQFNLTNGTTSSYLGDGVSGAYIWGAQLELGSLPTAYQPIAAAYGPSVNGASQTGDTLMIDGCSPSESAFLKAGDYIQLGSGVTASLYKVLTDTPTDETGQATVDIWPDLRSSPADNDTVVVANTKGRFRLKDNITQWNINEISSYGITFDCVEAI